jgi:ribosomal-protein-alanine N-acetyltransferase
MRVIQTARLTLEPQVATHAQAMFAVLSDPAIYRFENMPPVSLEWLRDRFAALELRRSPDGREQWLNWVLRVQDGGLIGFVQATIDAEGRACIAYELGSAHWGRGLAREAVEALIGELRTRYRVHTLTAIFKRANERSRHLLERLGFVPTSARAATPDEDMMTLRLAPAPGIR